MQWRKDFTQISFTQQEVEVMLGEMVEFINEIKKVLI